MSWRTRSTGPSDRRPAFALAQAIHLHRRSGAHRDHSARGIHALRLGWRPDCVGLTPIPSGWRLGERLAAASGSSYSAARLLGCQRRGPHSVPRGVTARRFYSASTPSPAGVPPGMAAPPRHRCTPQPRGARPRRSQRDRRHRRPGRRARPDVDAESVTPCAAPDPSRASIVCGPASARCTRSCPSHEPGAKWLGAQPLVPPGGVGGR